MLKQESDDFIAIKNSLIDRLLFGFSILIIIALAGSLYRALQIGFLPIMYAHISASIFFALAYLFRKKLSASFKGYFITLIFFSVGVLGLFDFGLAGAGTFILAVSAILASLIVTTRYAIVLAVIGALLQLYLVLQIVVGDAKFSVELTGYLMTVAPWVNNLTAYVFMTSVCIFIIDKFFTYLKNMSSVLQDAVEQKAAELEHSEVLLTTVMNSLPFGVFWKNKQGEFLGANSRFIDDVGLEHVGQLVGKKDDDFVSQQKADEYRLVDEQVLKTGVPVSNRVEGFETDFGKEYFTSTNKVPLRDKSHEIIGVLATYEDITEAKNMEIALREAMKSAQQASKAKSEFLATMSHEIRTPINGVMGLLELVLETPLTEYQREYLTKAELSAHTLLHIINQILDISKIEAGKMEIERIPFKIDDVVLLLEQQIRHMAENKGLEFVVQQRGLLQQTILGDPTKLLQILVNLCSNAVKFTDSGEITLTVSAVKKTTQLLVKVTVADSGIGIELDKLNSLFSAFTQADSSTTRKFGGTGLGLAIVKQLLEMQGGEVSVSSSIGQGTKFEFTIEYEFSDKSISTQSQNQQTAKNLVGLKILVAEDNEINQLIARDMLLQCGASVVIAEDGDIAVKKVQQQHFDIVLMDIQMPNLDGIQAFKQISETPELNNIPVIALTANVMAHEVKHYIELGFTDHLGKPFQKEQLVTKINQCLHSNPE